MDEATISFWVRVPEESAEACRADTGNFSAYKSLFGTIPFLTWGVQQHLDEVTPPSYIGIYVGLADEGLRFDPPVLQVHLQTSDISSGGHRTPMVEFFGNAAINQSAFNGGLPLFTTDEWHHLFISWKLASVAATMYCAIDGVNQAGTDQLPAMCKQDLRGPNGHDCSAIYQELIDFATEDQLAVTFNFSHLPSNPFSIPAPLSVLHNPEPGAAVAKNPIYMIELADLYVYSNLMLTNSSWGRFVEDGKPRKPSDIEDDLGRKPDILLRGTNNWKVGNNTGLLGVDVDGSIKEDGQFTPTGKIASYKPDPKLNP